MDFTLTASNRGNMHIVSVSGDVDVYTAPRLDSHIRNAISAGTISIAIDLHECTYFDSEGIKVLLRAQRLLGDHSTITVIGATGSVRRVFQISGLDTVFPLLPTIHDLPGE